jgi:hypothetical protein
MHVVVPDGGDLPPSICAESQYLPSRMRPVLMDNVDALLPLTRFEISRR